MDVKKDTEKLQVESSNGSGNEGSNMRHQSESEIILTMVLQAVR